MLEAPPYQLLADLVLVLHFAVVAFVVAGPVLVVIGNLGASERRWHWVNEWRFRAAHCSAIAIVVAQAWLGVACPLTLLEGWLRMQASTPTYSGSFIEHWLQRALYYEAPAWVFLSGYTVFGLVVAALWWRFPPARRSQRPRAA